MKRTLVLAMLLASSGAVLTAEAGGPEGVPLGASATSMTARDDCFQSLRGKVEQSARLSKSQVLRMTEGSGSKMENGNYQCAARFEVRNADNQLETLPYYAISSVRD